MPTIQKPTAAPGHHWREYAIEAALLGIFMMSAGVATTAVEYAGSPLYSLVNAPWLRRLLIGLAMGGTAMALIYSRWGARSGAHFNPAVTITFAVLGKITWRDAAWYIAAQFAGGVIGVLAVRALLGQAFTLPPVLSVITVPGADGVEKAFWMEMLISFLLMSVTLVVSSRPASMRYTGLCCGVLIASFVTFEAPFSGMSMNPARTIASAAPSGIWTGAWIYFVAPVGGMLMAALTFRLIGREPVQCAKLNHDTGAPCPFLCNFKARGIHVPDLIRTRV